MRTSLIAASVLLVGATAMAATQAGTKAPAKPAAAKPAAMKTAHAAGTVEKFDAATHTLTVKEKGKEMQFVIGDSATLMRGKDKIDAAALSSATGSMVKVEYIVMGATKTAEKVELSAPAAAKPAAKKKNG
jgi:phage baseplate assembly protein gpV